MSLNKAIAKAAHLIGDKTRVNILVALMEGRALTAGELALRANISPQTASNHLKKLLAAKLIAHVKTPTRYRYYKIASPLVANALESLSLLTDSPKKRPPHHEKLDQDICFARTCYDHLAGELGVKVTNALLDKEIIKENQNYFQITPQGYHFFKELNIDCHSLLKQRRQFAKSCLDWTEREYHLAGSLGKALLDHLINQGIVIPSKKKSRVLILTTKGKLWLQNKFNL